MTPEQAVIERLLTVVAVQALIGSRAYLLKLPQHATMPAVRVQAISEGNVPHLRGSGGLCRTRVQVDAYAAEASGVDPYATAAGVAAAVNGDGAGSGLDGWSGSIGSPSIDVTGMLRIDRGADYDDDGRTVRVRQDYIVWWKPTQ